MWVAPAGTTKPVGDASTSRALWPLPVSPVDLRLDAEVLPSRVVAGNPITATFTVVNEGAAPASSVTLNVTLPAEPTVAGQNSFEAQCELGANQVRCGAAAAGPRRAPDDDGSDDSDHRGRRPADHDRNG